MKTVEKVLRELSNLYEFNKSLQTYTLQQPDAANAANVANVAKERQSSGPRCSGAEASPARVQDEAPSS